MTNRGGRVDACVANRMRGCLPPRSGCGCAATSSPRNALRRPVGMRVSQDASDRSSAGTSRSVCQPVRAEMLTRGAHGDLHELLLDLALEEGAAVLVHEVPLVVRDDERAAGVDDLLDHADVLLGQRVSTRRPGRRPTSAFSIAACGAQRGVEVGALGLVHAAADAGGVDEQPRHAAELDELVDRVARGAGDVVDDDALRARELVQQRGLADVRAADQRDAARARRGAACRARRPRAAPRSRRRAGRPCRGRAGRRPGTARRGPGTTGRRRRPRRAGRPPCWRTARRACPSGAAARTTRSSVSVAPTVASTTKITASASEIATSACSATRASMPATSISQPPVSTSMNRRPAHSAG